MAAVHLKEAKERVEDLLAGSKLAGDSRLREASYGRILNALSATKRPRETEPEATLELVLHAIGRAIESRQQAPRVRNLESRRAAYWRERTKLEGLIDCVATHPLLASFPRADIEFKSLDAAYCMHDNFREVCVWTRRQLERLESRPDDESALMFLDAIGVGADRRSDEFCGPEIGAITPEEYRAAVTPPPLPRRRSRGRPIDPTLEEYFTVATAALQRGGLSREVAFGLATELIGACLGDEPSAEYRVRRARRARSTPKAQGRKSPGDGRN